MNVTNYKAPGCLHAKEFEIVPEGVEYLSAFAFGSSSDYGNHCPLKHIKLPTTLRKIGASAFAYCKCLEEIIIPEGVEEIENSVFCGCESLKHVSFPKSLKKLGMFCFEGCTKIERITIADIEAWGRVRTSDYNGWKYASPAPSLWLNDTPLDSVTIPHSLTQNIDRSNPIAFRNFANIRRVEYLPESEFAGFDFSECLNLSEIIYPSQVQVLNLNSYAHCPSIRSIVFPKTITNSCVGAFDESVVLRFAEVDDGVLYVGDWCVGGDCKCANIRTGTVGIANGAFSKSQNLQEVVIPSTVRKIGFQAFSFIKNLCTVRFLGETPEIASEAFTNVWRDGRPLSVGAKVFVRDRKIFAPRKTRLDLLRPPHRIIMEGAEEEYACDYVDDWVVERGPTMILQDPQSVLYGDVRRWFYNVAGVGHLNIRKILKNTGKTDEAFIVAVARLVKQAGFEITTGLSELDYLAGCNELARRKLEALIRQIM